MLPQDLWFSGVTARTSCLHTWHCRDTRDALVLVSVTPVAACCLLHTVLVHQLNELARHHPACVSQATLRFSCPCFPGRLQVFLPLFSQGLLWFSGARVSPGRLWFSGACVSPGRLQVICGARVPLGRRWFLWGLCSPRLSVVSLGPVFPTSPFCCLALSRPFCRPWIATCEQPIAHIMDFADHII